MVPVFLIEIVLGPMAPADETKHQQHVSEMLAACSSILEEGRCTTSDDSLREHEQLQGRATVHWQSERIASIVFKFEHSALVFGPEKLAFSALDPRDEWYRALGLAIGSVASRAHEDEPHSTEDQNAAPADRGAGEERANSGVLPQASGGEGSSRVGGAIAAFDVVGVPEQSLADEEPQEQSLLGAGASDDEEGNVVSSERIEVVTDGGIASEEDAEESIDADDRWWEEPEKSKWVLPAWRTSVNLLTGPAFDDGSWRWGAELQQSFGWGKFPVYPVLGAYFLSRPGVFGVTWWGFEAGAEFGFSPPSWPVGLYGQTLFLVESTRAGGDGSPQRAATFGAKLNVSVQWPARGWWAVRFNGGFNSLFNRTVLIVNADQETPSRLSTSPFQPLLGVGFSLRF